MCYGVDEYVHIGGKRIWLGWITPVVILGFFILLALTVKR